MESENRCQVLLGGGAESGLFSAHALLTSPPGRAWEPAELNFGTLGRCFPAPASVSPCKLGGWSEDISQA